MQNYRRSSEEERVEGDPTDPLRSTLVVAMNHAVAARDLLDSVAAPADIGAHVQNAVDRIRALLEQ